MKDIAIVTLFDYNLGNRLQNYALQTYLQGMNMNVKTLKYISSKSLRRIVKDDIKLVLGMIGIKKYKIYWWNKQRKSNFDIFNKLYINFGEIVEPNKEIKINTKNYDYFIVGSDQVWHNWRNGNNELDYFYLTFVEEEKRISYAPSFGFSEFPKEDIKKHICGLKGIRALSCREEDGCDLIKRTIGREAIRLIDPSFLLTNEQWRSVERKPKWFSKKQKLIVTYFLGNKPKEYIEYIDDLSKKKNAQIINIFSKDKKEEYIISPDEFLYLIDNADYVCTDSFHACAFSLIFNRNLIAFPRKQDGMEDMKGRIDTLFSVLNIKSRWYTDLNDNFDENIEYYSLIDKEREKASKYLNDYLF